MDVKETKNDTEEQLRTRTMDTILSFIEDEKTMFAFAFLNKSTYARYIQNEKSIFWINLLQKRFNIEETDCASSPKEAFFKEMLESLDYKIVEMGSNVGDVFEMIEAPGCKNNIFYKTSVSEENDDDDQIERGEERENDEYAEEERDFRDYIREKRENNKCNENHELYELTENCDIPKMDKLRGEMEEDDYEEEEEKRDKKKCSNKVFYKMFKPGKNKKAYRMSKLEKDENVIMLQEERLRKRVVNDILTKYLY